MQITLQELNMTYPNGKKALQGVSASLDSPSLIGLLGPNASGPTRPAWAICPRTSVCLTS